VTIFYAHVSLRAFLGAPNCVWSGYGLRCHIHDMQLINRLN
jgi:hypothetical protein